MRRKSSVGVLRTEHRSRFGLNRGQLPHTFSLHLLWRCLDCVVEFSDAPVRFLVQFITLLAGFFVVTFPDLFGDFVNLLRDFALSRIFHCRYPSECPGLLDTSRDRSFALLERRFDG